MAEKYYNLEMEGAVVKEKLDQVASKLNIDGGNATNLKVTINSETDNENYAANHGYVNNTISNYVKLGINHTLTIGQTELILDNTYLHNIGDKKIKLADNSQVDFGVTGQILTSSGSGKAPIWVNAKEIVIDEQIPNEIDVNGVANIAVDETNTHKLIVTKDSFIRTADLGDAESPIGLALAAKVDLSTLYGETAVLVSKPDYVLQVSTDKENQVLKTIKDENEQIKIVWKDEKVFALNVVEDDSSGSMPEDAAEVVSSLRYDEPDLYVYTEQTVNYTAYKAFEASVANLLDQKATKAELEDYATKEDLGDQFTMEFDSSTKTLTIIRK